MFVVDVVAVAFSEEVFRLNMLLDEETNRVKARKKYAEKVRAKRQWAYENVGLWRSS